MSADTHQHHVSSKMIPGRLHMHTRPLHSVNPCLITSTEISTGLPAFFFLMFFLALHPISLVDFSRLKFHSFFFLLSLYKANPGRGWCEDQAEQGCEEYKHFFLLSRGKGGGGGLGGLGAEGWAVGSVKETRTLSQPSSSVIRRHDKVAARKTLQGWHNPKTD